jgi:6-hydroxymethylpterin diphosphokinase MptE-like
MHSPESARPSAAVQAVYRAKRLVPAPLWRTLTGPYWWWYNRARHQAAALLDGRLRASQKAVAAYRDLHRGRRCFVLGNGPSLRHTDLPRLRDEITFGANRIYLLFPELGFPTTYYVAVNTLVVEQCAPEIAALEVPRFITWRARRWLPAHARTHFLDTDYTAPATFTGDPTRRLFEGSTVTYTALQLAFYMGCDPVILIGVDHSFTTQGQPNVTVVSTGDDPNHFAPGYFGKGFRWQLPDLEASEAAYRLARDAYAAAGRTILDATIGGKLTVFPKVDYRSLFP